MIHSRRCGSCFCGFAGSLGYNDTEEALSALGRLVGPYATRYPDGETGKRHKWITWQREVFEQSPQFEVAGTYTNRDGLGFDMFRPVVEPSKLEMHLGYARYATESYRAFCRLREQGKVPRGPRFQVSLPTPTAILTVFVDREHRERVAPALQAAMLREVEGVLAAIPAEELAIQWDVAVEVIGYEGGGAAPRYPLHVEPRSRIPQYTAEVISALSAGIPEAAQLGVHLCCGSAIPRKGMLRAVTPKDLSTSVLFANTFLDRCPRRVDFLHMLSPQDRVDRHWFTPLAGLKAGPELLLGVVHLADGVSGAIARGLACRRHAGDLGGARGFGVAAECGLGGLMEYGREKMETMLAVHAGTVRWFQEHCEALIGLPGGHVTLQALRHYHCTGQGSRVQQIVAAVTKALHSAIRELRPSHDEWSSFLSFLNRTVRCCTETRNEFVMLLDFLGVRPLLDELEASSWPSDATPPSAVGPFRDKDVPNYPSHGGNLCLRAPPATATPCEYEFSAVSSGERRPLRGAEFEVWMADQDGVYSVRDSQAPKHNLYGKIPADDEGRASFRALKPRNYGVNTTGTGGALLAAWGKSPTRPGHVHVAVRAPGYEPLVTSLYFDDDPYLWQDPAWGVSAPLVVSATRRSGGKAPLVRYTFTLRPSPTDTACIAPPEKQARLAREDCEVSAPNAAPEAPEGITAAALRAAQGCSDERTRRALSVAVRALHELARELRPTLEEYQQMLGFLHGFRHPALDSSVSEEFAAISEILGVSTLIGELSATASGGEGWMPTPAAPPGPFRSACPPARESGAKLFADGCGGDACTFRFEVRAAGGAGVPLAGATLEVWMADKDGMYSPQVQRRGPNDGYGAFRCDAEGCCTFEGVVPGGSWMSADRPLGQFLEACGRPLARPAQVHVVLAAAGHAPLCTALYDRRDPQLTTGASAVMLDELAVDFSLREVSFVFRLARTITG